MGTCSQDSPPEVLPELPGRWTDLAGVHAVLSLRQIVKVNVVCP